MFPPEQKFEEGRNWAVVVGNSYAHQNTEDGYPENMLPILKKAQIEAMQEGDEDRSQVAIELDYILIELFPEYTSEVERESRAR